MPLAARPVTWPENIDLNDTTPYAFSAVFASTIDGHGRRALHTHPTGMIGMRIEGGRYGLELADGFVAVPSRCAVALCGLGAAGVSAQCGAGDGYEIIVAAHCAGSGTEDVRGAVALLFESYDG